jgi:hypothetical protein
MIYVSPTCFGGYKCAIFRENKMAGFNTNDKLLFTNLFSL